MFSSRSHVSTIPLLFTSASLASGYSFEIPLCLFLSVPAATALVLASHQIITSLFGYGSFNNESVMNYDTGGHGELADMIVEKGIEASTKLKPSAYYNPKTVELITPLNYDDHIERIKECDWIIEVIAERLDWKLDLFNKIQPHLKKNAIKFFSWKIQENRFVRFVSNDK